MVAGEAVVGQVDVDEGGDDAGEPFLEVDSDAVSDVQVVVGEGEEVDDVGQP